MMIYFFIINYLLINYDDDHCSCHGLVGMVNGMVGSNNHNIIINNNNL